MLPVGIDATHILKIPRSLSELGWWPVGIMYRIVAPIILMRAGKKLWTLNSVASIFSPCHSTNMRNFLANWLVVVQKAADDVCRPLASALLTERVFDAVVLAARGPDYPSRHLARSTHRTQWLTTSGLKWRTSIFRSLRSSKRSTKSTGRASVPRTARDPSRERINPGEGNLESRSPARMNRSLML
jgi:hypothetical protein